MKSWLEKHAMKMSSTNNEGKSVVAEKFIRTLENEISRFQFLKYVTSVPKKVCILMN